MFKREASMKNLQNINFQGLFNQQKVNDYGDISANGFKSARDISAGNAMRRSQGTISRTSSS